MNFLVTVSAPEDIFPEYRDTPIGRLLEYNNLGRPLDTYTEAKLLIGMCMDNRIYLRIPHNFAYIIRSGGANLRYSEFMVSYAISVGGVKSIALIGHNNCGMVNLMSKKDAFVNGLVKRAGWDKASADDHFMKNVPVFDISNEIDFVISETKRLRLRYPGILIAALLCRVENNLLYLIVEP